MDRLATFLHISDLHIGTLDMGNRDAYAPEILAHFPQFEGLLGHSYKSLVKLEKFWSQLQQNEDAKLIVTGDLTRVGHSKEFSSVQDFLGSYWELAPNRPLGLRAQDWQERTVPGNHDHWPGETCMFGGPTQGVHDLFSHLPTLSSLPLAWQGGALQLQFLRINTDANVRPYSFNRLAARGDFSSQLLTLRDQLDVPQPTDIRLLCLHHSLLHPGLTLGMTNRSRRLLHEFIRDFGIKVLLCGHIHSPPQARVFPVGHHQPSGQALEVCCGTTTQMDCAPYAWRNLWGKRPQPRQRYLNSLMVHRVTHNKGKIYWASEVYFENSYRFEKADVQLQKKLVHGKFQLWPSYTT